jgi:predicted ester cyclase
VYERNKTIGSKWFLEMWNKPDYSIVEEIVDQNYHPDWVQMDMKGPNLLKHEIKYFRSIFPDLEYEIRDMVSEDEKILIRYLGKGTHLGNAWGFAPTNKKVEFEGVSILYISSEGKVIDQWGMFCFYDIFTDLELVPPYWELNEHLKR